MLKNILFNLLVLVGLISLFLPESNYFLANPLIPLAIAGGSSLIGKLFGSRKPKLSAEQRYAADQYRNLIAGQGYLPGERDLVEANLSRNLGAQEGIERALQNRRLAATPGLQDTAFGDAQQQALSNQYAQALSSGLTSQDIAAKNRMLQAIGGIGGMQPGQLSKGNAFDALGDIGNATLPIFAQQYGNKVSAREAKDNIQDLGEGNEDQIMQLLNSLDLKSFNYKPEFGDPNEQKIGPIANDAPPPISQDGQTIDMDNLIMMMLAAIQKLSKELEMNKEFSKRQKEVKALEAVANG